MDPQSRLATFFDPLSSRAGQIVNLGIAVLVVVFSVLFVVETYPIPDSARDYLHVIDVGILLLFTLEYGLRLLAADNKIRYLLSVYSVIDLLAIVPFWFGLFDIRYVRSLRLLEGFRILRLIRFIEQPLLGKTPPEDKIVILRIVYTLFSIIFIYSGLIYQMEHTINTENFRTFLDAFYFSVVTMTTVGFGDVTPATESGRLFTVLMILTGIAVIPWQIGDLIQRLAKSRAPRETICPGCGLAFHEADAVFCRRCGTLLPPPSSSRKANSPQTTQTPL